MTEWAICSAKGLVFLDISSKDCRALLSDEEPIHFDLGQIINVFWVESGLKRDIVLLNVHELFYEQIGSNLNNYLLIYNRQLR